MILYPLLYTLITATVVLCCLLCLNKLLENVIKTTLSSMKTSEKKLDYEYYVSAVEELRKEAKELEEEIRVKKLPELNMCDEHNIVFLGEECPLCSQNNAKVSPEREEK